MQTVEKLPITVLSGISEPFPIASDFLYLDEEGESLSDVARLGSMVTVADPFPSWVPSTHAMEATKWL